MACLVVHPSYYQITMGRSHKWNCPQSKGRASWCFSCDRKRRGQIILMSFQNLASVQFFLDMKIWEMIIRLSLNKTCSRCYKPLKAFLRSLVMIHFLRTYNKSNKVLEFNFKPFFHSGSQKISCFLFKQIISYWCLLLCWLTRILIPPERSEGGV